MKKQLLAAALVAAAPAAFAQLPFSPLDTNYQTTTVIVNPAGSTQMKMDALFSGAANYVYINNGTDSAAAKQNHDYLVYVPINGSSDTGWIFVNHETGTAKNAKLGDGGGMSYFKAVKTPAGWKAVPSKAGKIYQHVDFSAVGFTYNNCAGAHVPGTYTIMTAEENVPSSNSSIYSSGNGIQDTSDFVIPAGNGIYSGKTLKKYENFGWMVEVDPNTGLAKRKLYGMGRYGHEGGFVMADQKTVYLTDDATPGMLYKYVANTANDFTAGQLYAYKEGANGTSGSWLTLPMALDSVKIAPKIAQRMGATGYTRLEWVKEIDGKLYITETGTDNPNFKGAWLGGCTPAQHQLKMDTLGGQPKDSVWNDYYGRVLVLDLNTNIMRPYINGGFSTDGKTNFSNPDGLALVTQNGKKYLVINEDLNGNDKGRSPGNNNNCEIFYLDLSLANPTVDDLKRFLIGPKGAETTGGYFTPDGKTYFVNIQHPDGNNPAPFNNSTTIALTGFNLIPSAVTEVKGQTQSLKIYPNPASRELHLSKASDVALYNAQGVRILVQRNAETIDISNLVPGNYFLQTVSGEVHKVIIQ